MLSEISYNALESLGIPTLVRGIRNAAPVLCYHNVAPASHHGDLGDASLHLPVDHFEAQIEWLSSHYNVVPLDELVGRLLQSHSVRGLAAVTFDDAYAGVFQYAWPTLKARGVPATVFVVAGAAERPAPFWWDYPATQHASAAERERWLTACHGDARAVLPADAPQPSLPGYMWPASWVSIRQAASEGLGIGAHSMTHRALTSLTEREIQFEVAPCRSVIAQRTGVRPSLFSYPYGLLDQRACDAVRAANYVAALSMEPGLNDSDDNRWALKRINVPASLTQVRFEAWAAGLVPPQRKSA